VTNGQKLQRQSEMHVGLSIYNRIRWIILWRQQCLTFTNTAGTHE